MHLPALPQPPVLLAQPMQAPLLLMLQVRVPRLLQAQLLLQGLLLGRRHPSPSPSAPPGCSGPA